MIALLFSILASSFIFVLFKLFPKFKIDTFQAIVFNYITAFCCGIFLFGHDWRWEALEKGHWVTYAFGAALLFISLFLLMGLSSQKNGVGQTSIAVKMSMGLSILLIIFFINRANQTVTIGMISGFLLACLGVFLSSYESQKLDKINHSKWMLFVLFIGSSMLDVILNAVEQYEKQNISVALFSAFGLGLAGAFGIIVLLIQLIANKTKFQFRNVIAGIFLGIPNYFSIYLLMLSYSSSGLDGSTVLTITNVSVVLLTSLIGFMAFNEHLTRQKIIGLLAAIAAILVIYFTNVSAR
jgi:drug/metabolite transporter (DMT)-like permease